MYFTVTNLIICIYSQKTEPTNSATLQACGYITIFILLKERKEGKKEKGKTKHTKNRVGREN